MFSHSMPPAGANAPRGAEHRIALGERLKGATPGKRDENKTVPWKGTTIDAIYCNPNYCVNCGSLPGHKSLGLPDGGFLSPAGFVTHRYPMFCPCGAFVP